MNSLQRRFIAFDKAIRLGNGEEKSWLRQRRTTLIQSLNDSLSRAPDGGNLCIKESFLQGSFAMHTGVKPVDDSKDIDLDVGLVLNLRLSRNRLDPVAVKEKLSKVLRVGTRRVDIRRSCLTVYYDNQRERPYHVDLAIYVEDDSGRLYLASGRLNSRSEKRIWVHSNPKGLLKHVGEHLRGDQRSQFHRVVRYLKRWRDLIFSASGNGAPAGIGLTIMVLKTFKPVFDHSGQPDDFSALYATVSALVAQYKTVFLGVMTFTRTLKAQLPVEPHSDVLGKMTVRQNEALGEALVQLLDVLKQVRAASNTGEQVRLMQSVFGKSFW